MVEIVEADGEAVDLVVADLVAAVVEDLVDSVAEVQVGVAHPADGRLFIRLGIVNIEKPDQLVRLF